MSEYAVFRGRGGGLHRFKLPLAPAFAAQEAKGYLVRVEDDADEAPRPVRKKADPEPKPDGRPSRQDPKHDWVAWAVQQQPDMSADDAAEMTKAELVERFG